MTQRKAAAEKSVAELKGSVHGSELRPEDSKRIWGADHPHNAGSSRRAALIDRDGVLNELVYYSDPGIADSPFTPSQFELVQGIGPALRAIKSAGYKLVLVSNQPSMAKKHLTFATFRKIQAKMHRLFAAEGVELDGEYYCFHHPQAKIAKYRVDCECRKPKPGMLLKAAEELDLDLARSVMIGDGLYDILAGKRAGCRTILVANLNPLLTRKMDELGAKPDYVARNVAEAAEIVKKMARGDSAR